MDQKEGKNWLKFCKKWPTVEICSKKKKWLKWVENIQFFLRNAKNGLQIKRKWLKIGKNELKIEFVSKERKGRYGCTTYKNFPKMDKK